MAAATDRCWQNNIFQFERWRQLALLGTYLLCAHVIEAPILQMSALDTLAVIGKGNKLVINDPLTHFLFKLPVVV